MKSPSVPWIALLAGPSLALANQLANFVAVPWVCATGNYWLLHAFHVIAIALAVWAGSISHRLWQIRGGGASSEAGDIESRDHFLGFIGVMTAAFSVALLLAMWYPNFVLGACQ